MNRLVLPGELRQRQKSTRFTPAERAFNKWLHTEGTCCLTDYPQFHIAHVGGLSEGKGMSEKSFLGTALPLRFELHLLEERTRLTFWEQVGFPDYLKWAADLYEVHKEGGHPQDILQDMHRQADRSIISDMLTNPNDF